MKWICDRCKSINAELAFICHNCGLDRPQDNGPHYAYYTSDKTFIPFNMNYARVTQDGKIEYSLDGAFWVSISEREIFKGKL